MPKQLKEPLMVFLSHLLTCCRKKNERDEVKLIIQKLVKPSATLENTAQGKAFAKVLLAKLFNDHASLRTDDNLDRLRDFHDFISNPTPRVTRRR